MATQLLRDQVTRAIMDFAPIRTSETAIDVHVENGNVVLDGYVRTDTQRTLVSQLANSVRGVAGVRNNLLSDSDLEVTVGQVIELELGTYIVPMMPVVRVIRGNVFLRGPVPSEGARTIIEDVALQIPGVLMVHNLLDVNPVAIERLIAPKKAARRASGPATGAGQAMVGGQPVTAADLPDWAMKSKEEWGMAEYKARARVKMAFKAGNGPDPKELEEAGAVLRAGAGGDEPAAESLESSEALVSPLEPEEMITNPSPVVEEEAVPEAAVDLETLRGQYPAWALKPKEEWDKDDFKAQMQAKRAAKAGEGEAPEVIIEKAQAALAAAQQGGRKKQATAPQNAQQAALAAVRAQFPGWALAGRREWQAQDFQEAADARVAELRGTGRSISETRAEAQAALEAAMRGEAVSGKSAATRRDLTPEEVAAVQDSLLGQYPAWALKPKEEWDKDDFKGQMQAKRAAKSGEGEDPEAIIQAAQAALERSLQAAREALPLEGGDDEPAAPAAPEAREISAELWERYPSWALKPKEAWDKDEFKAHAKAKSAFKRGEGQDPDATIAEAQAAIG
jgi:hypothetical protein